MGETDPAGAGQRQIKADRRMSHRLRLYFGSGRSNTAPELEQLNWAAENRDVNATSNWRSHNGAGAMMFHTQSQNGGHAENPESGTVDVSDASLKRSSSMFIPQLQGQTEPRMTKSTSMQISLQRSSAPQEDASSLDPPPGYPQDPAPAYSEPEDDWLLPPPPAYHRAVNPSCHSVEQSQPGTEGIQPKRRVFCVRPCDGQNGFARMGVNNGNPQGITINGFSIQRRSADGSDVQQLRIMPYSQDGQNGPCHRWSVQQSTDGGPGTQRLVFQLQQDQGLHANTNSQAEVAELGSKGGRMMRYPQIRLERSTSQPLQPRAVPARLGSMPDLHAPISEMETESEIVQNRAQGCTFKIKKEPNSRQPRFKIYVSQGAENGPITKRDISFGKVPTCISPQVITAGKAFPLNMKLSVFLTTFIELLLVKEFEVYNNTWRFCSVTNIKLSYWLQTRPHKVYFISGWKIGKIDEEQFAGFGGRKRRWVRE